MKSLFLRGEQVRLQEIPSPSPDGEPRIALRLAGICRTDLELAKGYMGYEGVLGHEFVGTLLDATDSLSAGTRVVGEINCGCGRCSWCHSGLERHCPNRTVLGISGRPGCFSEQLTLPERNLVPVPDSIPDERAVFAEPLAAVIEIFEQIPVRPMDSVAIIGDGKLGLLIGMVFTRHHTGPAFLIGHHPSKWKSIPEIPCIHENEIGNDMNAQFDIVIEASGTVSGLARAQQIIRPRGTIVLKSTMERSEPLNLTVSVVNEVTIVGSRCGRLPTAIRFLERTDLPVERLIEATYPLDRAKEAWKHACQSGALKICLKTKESA
ncbi:MAG TPA: alcohol dehydrogenase catalytic domain-containing protein [bacterium]|nr:alcohol dehydrogenase catalytic domain-containing protein [bacterium]HPO09630.1 alcohol dehydrogenase catalytic domain-containing protein [bacterium]HQO33800.1 alcohol dehydrogenase catalytic domain-containing protein [bacterium]HQP97642.1 alcohol dehydrogenase catalytic domain-containing protein [bacterium]